MSEPHEIPITFDPEEFDRWAEGYDQETELASGFPFEGYPELLDEIIRCAHISRPQRVLDLGTGTGNLALRFYALGCTVWGTDFSCDMLEKAQLKIQHRPEGIAFSYWDLRDPWPRDLPERFDRIVSAYTLHHFDLGDKLSLLAELAAHLAPGGRLSIGDIAFETRAQLDQGRERYGDAWDEEHYWVAEEMLPALENAGWQASYQQVSGCAGVYCLRSRE
jgi:putative AdoMet-dependent methyltransferase